MGRIYNIVLDAIAVTAVADLVWIGSPTDAITILHEVEITQDLVEISEQLPLNLFRTTTDNSANGTSNTPNPIQVGDPAYGGTVRTNITGGSLATESTMLRRASQNVLNGWHWLFTPETRIVLTPAAGTAGRLVIKLDAAPAASLSFSGVVTIEEVGG
jgi:hypothetical protein